MRKVFSHELAFASCHSSQTQQLTFQQHATPTLGTAHAPGPSRMAASRAQMVCVSSFEGVSM